jgi:hypothetical protein
MGPKQLDEIYREIRFLKKEVKHLSKALESIKCIFIEDSSSVERMLRMRRIQILRKNPIDQIFLPPDLLPFSKIRFYEMMKKYSFRLVLRDMVKYQDRFCIEDLTHYCSSKVAQGYCDLLVEMGAIKKKGRGGYRTSAFPLYSFGPTLEWFIAEMFKREFASPAIYGVSVKGTPSGGDYDVIASWNQRLVYVEAKSSPPKGIELSEVSTFFSRIEDLQPEVAFFFNDTQLRMKDKLVVMFEEELERRHGRQSRTLYPVERLLQELFHVQDHIFIVNSKKDVVENFHLCLKHYLQYGTPSPSPLPAGEREKVRGFPPRSQGREE